MAQARNYTEARMHQRLTEAYLDAEPDEVALKRPTMVKTPSGGYIKGPDTQLPAQVFRLVPFKKKLTSLTRDTPDGNIVNLQYVLIGEADTDVEVGDTFDYEGGIYDVMSIEPNRTFRVAANITYRGRIVQE